MQLRFARHETAQPTARERAPQLHGDQQREGAARREQANRSLDEQRGDVDLRGESAAGAGRRSAGFPRRRARDLEVAAKLGALLRREPMKSNPRRIADDETEPTAQPDVREEHGKREWKCAASGDAPPHRSERRRTSSQVDDGVSFVA